MIQKSGPADQKARTAWLKSEHGFGTNQASWLAAHASGNDQVIHEVDDASYLQTAANYRKAMYPDRKGPLTPITTPCSTWIQAWQGCTRLSVQDDGYLYRKHVFGQIKPTTSTHMDLRLAR